MARERCVRATSNEFFFVSNSGVSILSLPQLSRNFRQGPKLLPLGPFRYWMPEARYPLVRHSIQYSKARLQFTKPKSTHTQYVIRTLQCGTRCRVTIYHHRLDTMSTPTTSRHVDYFASRPVARSRPSALGATVGTPGSPRTPLLNRSVSGQFGSPGPLNREPEEIVIYELHPRFISAGFAGESRPRCVHRFGYQVGDGRRVGDYREFTDPSRSTPPRDRNDDRWSSPFELFRADVRQLDLALVSDRLERAVRQIHSDHLQLV